MNRLLALFAAFAVIITACGSDAEDSAATTTAPPTTEAPAETTTTAAEEPDEETDSELDLLDAENLCLDAFTAWQNIDGHDLLGLATQEAADAITERAGSVGALRSSGTDCFFMEIHAQTDGELAAVGDLTLGTRNGSPIVESIEWRPASDLDSDAELAARVDAAFLVVGIGEETDGGGHLSLDDYTEAEIQALQADCVYGYTVIEAGIDSCATLLQLGFDANEAYGLGNSYTQAPDEFIIDFCADGDVVACAEGEVRGLFDGEGDGAIGGGGDGAPLSLDDFTTEEIQQFQINCIYGTGVLDDGTDTCATLEMAGLGSDTNYGLGNSYSQAPEDLLTADCDAGDVFACVELDSRFGVIID